MAKTVATVGPKCACAFGFNISSSMSEQSDIDAEIALIEAEGVTLTPAERATVAVRVRRALGPLWSQKAEDELRRDQMRQATFILASHVNPDGTCPGRVGEAPEKVAYDNGRAQPLNFAQRLDLAEKVVAAHGGKTRDNEPSATVDHIREHKSKEKARLN